LRQKVFIFENNLILNIFFGKLNYILLPIYLFNDRVKNIKSTTNRQCDVFILKFFNKEGEHGRDHFRNPQPDENIQGIHRRERREFASAARPYSCPDRAEWRRQNHLL
jgi:hypothetical protein